MLFRSPASWSAPASARSVPPGVPDRSPCSAPRSALGDALLDTVEHLPLEGHAVERVDLDDTRRAGHVHLGQPVADHVDARESDRSEERRLGKERRSRWSPVP